METSRSAADAWNTADAPDKFFAVVPDAAKGPNGKKSLRKLPLASVQKHDLDPAIIRDALSRFNQTDFAGVGVSKDHALSIICTAARKFNIGGELCAGRGAAQSHLGSDKDVGSSQSPTQTQDPEKKQGKNEQEKMNLPDDLNEKGAGKSEQLKTEQTEQARSASKVSTTEVAFNDVDHELIRTLREAVQTQTTQIEALMTERHAARVAKVLDLKTKLDLVKDEKAERERLAKLSDAVLETLETELSSLASRVAAFVGPKVEHGEEEMRTAEEDMREQLYGYRRDAKQIDTTSGLGKIVEAS